MSQNFLSDCKLVRVMNAVAAGTSNQTTSAVDTGGPDGFDNVAFLASFGTISGTAVTSLKAQQSSDDAVADAYDDLAGSSQSVADTGSNGDIVLEIVRPEKRYLKAVILRGTANAVINGVWALLFHSRNKPPVQAASLLASKVLVTPPEGTA